MNTKTETPIADDILHNSDVAENTIAAIGRCNSSIVGYQSACDVASHAIASGQVNSFVEALGTNEHEVHDTKLIAEAAIAYYIMEVVAEFGDENKKKAIEILKKSVDTACEEHGIR